MYTFTELGGRFYAAHGLAEMGRSLFVLGNDAEAQRAWHESLRIATEIHGVPVALYALIGLASLLAKRGDMERALEVAFIISNHPTSSHDTRNRAAHLRVELEAQLTPQQVEAARARARIKTFDGLVEEVLNLAD